MNTPDDAATPAHTQHEQHRYLVHFPAHPARKNDPHYKDFDAYHKRTRQTARCYIGVRIGFGECRDEHGNPCIIDDATGEQSGLELHHAHIEYAVQNAVDLAALDVDYPGIADPATVGAWVESGTNFRWLCVAHHRAEKGAHSVSHSDWEASQYIKGLLS